MEKHDIEESGPTPRRTTTMRRRLVVVACALVILVGGGLTAALAVDSSADKPVKKRVDATTAPIVQGPLEGTSSASGTLAFGGSRGISGGGSGVITALPTPGATIKLGESLFAVANQSTYLMYGGLPVWRPFESGMSDGPDVKALEESLKALSFFDREPDERFDWYTKAAIQRWQKATGQEQTGTIEFGRIVFATGPVRVSELKAAVGDQAGMGGPLIMVTDLTKFVSVNLKLGDQQLGVLGAKVAIDLPNGKSTNGTITSVGVPTEQDSSSSGKETVVPVVIALDDDAAAGDLQQATVTVKFPTEKRENVLSVPVGALLALNDNQFGVELVQPDGSFQRVPVKTGLFAAGQVEISGDGIREGQKVVVPSL